MIRFVQRYLDPSDRLSETLFGVIMTLTFTLGADLVVGEGPDATRELLIGVIGCNIAWGLIDGLLYVFGSMYERGLGYRVWALLNREGKEKLAARLDERLEGDYGDFLSPATRAAVREDMLKRAGAGAPPRVRVIREDFYGAVVNFILVAITSVPAVLPFLFIQERVTALRVSNILLVGLMGVIGWKWAAYVNANRWVVGLGMVIGGLALVQLTILLGG